MVISEHRIEAITNRDTMRSELEAVIFALLVLGRKMRQLWVILESARGTERALRMLQDHLEDEAFMG